MNDRLKNLLNDFSEEEMEAMLEISDDFGDKEVADIFEKLKAIKAVDSLLNKCDKENRNPTKEESLELSSSLLRLAPNNVFVPIPNILGCDIEAAIKASKRTEECLVLKNNDRKVFEVCFLGEK